VSESFIPELRAARPWVMEEMIAAQPALIEAMDRPDIRHAVGQLAAAVVAAAEPGQPVIVSGCGTSEHAAMAVAAQLRLALGETSRSQLTIAARQAFEAWLEPQSAGLHLAISHEGETAATLAAMAGAAQAGARVMAITALAESRAAGLATTALVTPQRDLSWCHTVGYLSPIVAGALVAAQVMGAPAPLAALAAIARSALRLRNEAEALGRRLAGMRQLLVVGSGLDVIAASELALKVREGARLPATGYPRETVLHGYLAAAEPGDGLVVILTDPAGRPARLARARQVLAAAREIGMATAVIVVEDVVKELVAGEPARAGILPLPVVGSAAEALVASALGLQQLTVGLAAGRGANPDRIRREDAAHARAAAAAEAGGLAS
jgi:glutamine---fructose-6-phosphate transaminase (isomerizing)